jgi:hypothetical protein
MTTTTTKKTAAKAANPLLLWDSVQKTDPAYTKTFNRGYRGTQVTPHYLIRKATELFGPVGIGWGWTIVDSQYLPAHQISEHDRAERHVVQVEVWYRWQGERGTVTAYGSTWVTTKTSRGVTTDEDAEKKSQTDALTKALSYLGFAADVHLGMYDDAKYVHGLQAEFSEPEPRAVSAVEVESTKYKWRQAANDGQAQLEHEVKATPVEVRRAIGREFYLTLLRKTAEAERVADARNEASVEDLPTGDSE